jgi:MoxR-like ATPase
MAAVAELHPKTRALQANIERVVLGKPEPVRILLTALFARGHVLVEDIPGVGKTVLARALARSLSGTFRRIQFTPDLLPADITGASIYNADRQEFSFKPGPVFANVVLADEINRATPKTQSALLESMNEASVSVDGRTYGLPSPFLVAATQNPIEYLGTYPLPESQLDRFMISMSLGYPDREAELEILRSRRTTDPLDELSAVVTAAEVGQIADRVRDIAVEDSLQEYMLALAQYTRGHRDLVAGVSPRGLLHLMRAAQSHAFLAAREFVTPDDVQAVAPYVLPHRLIARQRRYLLDGLGFGRQVTAAALEEVPVPR